MTNPNIPNDKEIEEAVEVMKELFNLMSTPKLVKVDSKAYDRRNSLGTLIDLANQYLSGELIRKADVKGFPTVEEIADIFHIGESARKIKGVILQNVQNAKRRSDCLSEVESFFTETKKDEDNHDYEDCLLNWGAEQKEYKKQFAQALADYIPKAGLPTEKIIENIINKILPCECKNGSGVICIRCYYRKDLAHAIHTRLEGGGR